MKRINYKQILQERRTEKYQLLKEDNITYPHYHKHFDSWYTHAMQLYHAIQIRLPEYPKQNNTLDLIRRGFVKNMDNYPRWKDSRSMVNIELDTIRQILKELR